LNGAITKNGAVASVEGLRVSGNVSSKLKLRAYPNLVVKAALTVSVLSYETANTIPSVGAARTEYISNSLF